MGTKYANPDDAEWAARQRENNKRRQQQTILRSANVRRFVFFECGLCDDWDANLPAAYSKAATVRHVLAEHPNALT